MSSTPINQLGPLGGGFTSRQMGKLISRTLNEILQYVIHDIDEFGNKNLFYYETEPDDLQDADGFESTRYAVSINKGSDPSFGLVILELTNQDTGQNETFRIYMHISARIAHKRGL